MTQPNPFSSGSERPPALLVLEDGTTFRGRSFGAPGTTFGEAVFNTGMAGYQEVLTDPSYRRQIVTMTAPHIGNYGMNAADAESDRIQVAGYVVREAARRSSNWRAERELPDALLDEGIVAIEAIDTRALVRHLRDRGAMRAGISTEIDDPQALLQQVLDSPGMVGADLVSDVTPSERYRVPADGEARYRVAAFHFGMKRNIERQLAAHGCQVEVLPADTPADEVRALEPDGVFLSNGPGDPAAVGYAVDTINDLLGDLPVFGICLGNQLLGRALGADTYKLVFGHHGVNQPVLRREDGVVEITSHNHGFSVDAATLGEQRDEHTFETAAHGLVTVSHVNLNDDTVEGLTCHDIPAFSVQYHPEAAPGPHDARYLFQRFADLMDRVGARSR
ncbi:MAG: glutamine-hydrolyzing carbamoyl-phosphate synthase small subunit [Nitriliruptorales bacterium]|nr:glutamine-hydrolyzing carbamoyl-phosphate synthase small subunit [Nitriliruptorales bacterium]